MRHINMREARQRFSDLVKAAERGESTVITKRGRQVARLEPVDTGGDAELPDLADFRSSLKVKGEPLSEAVARGRGGARY